MRILHVGKFYPPDRGGMETFVYELAKAQNEQGHSVTVLSHKGEQNKKYAILQGHTNFASSLNDKTFPQKIVLERHAVQCTVGEYAPLSIGLAFAIFKHCRGKNKAQVIHVHTPNIAAFWVALFASQPIIVHWHSDVLLPHSTWKMKFLLKCWRKIEKYILRRATSIIATSRTYLEASPMLQMHHKKCHCVPLALPWQQYVYKDHHAVRFLQYNNSAQYINFLAVGRLTHYKGFTFLLDAVQKVPQARLCLIGTGILQKKLQEKIIQLGIQDRVLLAEDVENDDLQTCYECCQVFVLPSIFRTEAFGMVLLEAMRAAKPCIATSVLGSGMSEVVLDGHTGLVVPPHDSDALAQAMQYLITHQDLRAKMGKNGFLRWKQCYTIETISMEIEKIYLQALMNCQGNIE